MNNPIRLKVILSCLLALAVLVLLPVCAQAAEPASGQCGEGVTWAYDGAGTLTISGTGAMDDYPINTPPWEDLSDEITTLVVEEGVTHLGDSACYKYANVSSVSLPQSLTSIGNFAFYLNQSLTAIEIPGGVETLPEHIFEDCKALTTVKLNEGLSIISASAFDNCEALKEIVIPSTVTKVLSRAFSNCYDLKRITFLGSAPLIAYNAFRNVTADACYPLDDSWTEEVRENNNGRLTWYAGCFEHTFENYIFCNDATCTSDGTEYSNCSVCGYLSMRIAEGSKLPHTVSAFTANGDATCTADGTKSGICDICGNLDTVPDEGTRLPHSFTVFTSDGNATCADGTETALCDYGCGAKRTRTEEGSADPSLHEFIEVLMKAPSCTIGGVYAEICQSCGYARPGRTVPANGHEIRTLHASAATCTTQGYTGDQVCSVCGYIQARGSLIDFTGHKWDENKAHWTVTIHPTFSHTGIASTSCTEPGCDATQERQLPRLESQNPFTDVKTGFYSYDAIMWALREGITTGRTETRFMPTDNCLRAEVVTFLHRAVGDVANSDGTVFSDVHTYDYFYDHVNWAAKNGITTGITENLFAPYQVCTRAQVVTFLWRASGKPVVGGSNPFRDVPSGVYYYDAVLWAAQSGITTGTDATHFSPDATCTREQIVTFLYRCFATADNHTGPTAGQTDALSRARSLLEKSPYSYLGLVGELELNGCSHADAVYAADLCGADWSAQALDHGNRYLRANIGFSYTRLVTQLEYEKYTDGQIAYAMEHITVDWNEQALIRGRSYLKSSDFTRKELIAQLEYESFTRDQATYAADHLGL